MVIDCRLSALCLALNRAQPQSIEQLVSTLIDQAAYANVPSLPEQIITDIVQLRHYGVLVNEGVRGYSLASVFSPLDARALVAVLPAHCAVHYQTVITSTNEYLLSEHQYTTKLAICDFQTQGRGRKGAWLSGIGQNLLFSMRVPLVKTASITDLSLYVGLCLLRSLKLFVAGELAVKWPNDVLLNGQKIAGILIERRGSAVVVGVGVNVHQSPDLNDDSSSQSALAAGSLCNETAKINRQALAETVLPKLLVDIEQYVSQIDYPHESQNEWKQAWLVDWNAHHVFQNRAVNAVMNDKTELQGICRGVNAQGELLLDADNHQHRLTQHVRLRAQ